MTRMIGRISKVRHAVVGVAIGGSSLLGLTGLIGAGNHPERFDAKTIVVSPAGVDGLRITEYVDQDFGHHSRHGYERVIPNDFGAPFDVQAFSPDAPDAVSVTGLGDRTQIRIGDPDVTKQGQHRYQLSYTLPEAARAPTARSNLHRQCCSCLTTSWQNLPRSSSSRRGEFNRGRRKSC